MNEAKALPTSFGGDPAGFGTPAFSGGGGSSVLSRFGTGNSLMVGEEVAASMKGISNSARASPFPRMKLLDEELVRSTSAPVSNQISSLEVMGEDAEGRRKRFETTLANNRYLEVRSFSLT